VVEGVPGTILRTRIFFERGAGRDYVGCTLAANDVALPSTPMIFKNDPRKVYLGEASHQILHAFPRLSNDNQGMFDRRQGHDR
jgi:hypothetical protein